MKEIPTKDLRAGMRFSKPVYVDNETILIQPDLPLKQKEIDRLIRWEIKSVRTAGEIVGGPPTSTADTAVQAKAYSLSNTSWLVVPAWPREARRTATSTPYWGSRSVRFWNWTGT